MFNLLLVLVIIFLIYFIWINLSISKKYKNTLEKFIDKDDEYFFDITDEDKDTYFMIIDTYKTLLDREPSADELNKDYLDISKETITINDFHKRIQNTEEFKMLHNIQSNSTFSPTNAENDLEDMQKIQHYLFELMPNANEPDNIEMDYMMKKYRGLDKDEKKFKKYIRSTPEYKEYKQNQKPTINNVKNKLKSKVVALSDKVNNVEYQISKPNLNKTTLKVKSLLNEGNDELEEVLKRKRDHDDEKPDVDTCEFYKTAQEHQLAKLTNKRNLDKLKYHCEISKEYKNVDDKMVLLPGQEWSVPQKYTPVCHHAQCSVNPVLDQTALIGTILNTDENILPKFIYKEDESGGLLSMDKM